MTQYSVDFGQNETVWRIAVAALLGLIIVAAVQDKLYHFAMWAIWIPILLIPVALIWPIRPARALGYTLGPSIMAYLFTELFAPDSVLDVMFLVCICLPPVTLLPVPTICFIRMRWPNDLRDPLDSIREDWD